MARDAEQKPVTTFTLVDCFPIAFSASEAGPSGGTQVETIVVEVDRVEYA
ncbi:MAG: hypothetical protein ICV67_04980 [Thermoleophilia bacterium]|nr:hypothetical protein [Thermoleophilia bacterium]